MSGSSLSQDDFRRILATPRRELSGGIGDDGPKVQVSGGPKKKSTYRPAARRAVGGDDDEAGDDSSESKPAYRDRAKERREGTDAEYEESRRILQRLTQSEDADIRDLNEAESKFLGGDAAHTHLVRGLDFALLKLQRKEAEAAAAAATSSMGPPDAAPMGPPTMPTMAPSAASTGGPTVSSSKGLSAPLRSTTASVAPAAHHAAGRSEDSSPATPSVSSLAQRIVAAATGSVEEPVRKVDAFFPGRMVYVMDLQSSSSVAPGTVVRSKLDLKALRARTVDSLNDMVVHKICLLFHGLRAAGERLPVRAPPPAKASSSAASSSVTSSHASADDDDIFADAEAYKPPELSADPADDGGGSTADSWFNTAPPPSAPAPTLGSLAVKNKPRRDYDAEALGQDEGDLDEQPQYNAVAFEEGDDVEPEFVRPASLKRYGLKDDEPESSRGDAKRERQKLDKSMAQIDKIFKTKYNKGDFLKDDDKPEAAPKARAPLPVAATPKRRRLDVE